ncbi:MAG: SpoIID/LytB domain-containing protein [candidate division Zixibacteria bacterium]|nr:SpoIID/LytB domain-containing protein [candidate division Zixibacteria bacterium]MDD5425222.1 SpoIID/LytB domain-containing protein [candidate division Zixibacteria bacterium]
MDNTENKTALLKKTFKILTRLSLGLVLLVLAWSCATVPGLQEESVSTYIKIPFVRVLLEENNDRAVFGSDASFAIECLKGGQQTVFFSSQPIRVENLGERLRVVNKNQDIIQDNVEEVNIIPRGQNKHLRLNGFAYRGIMKILPYGRSLRLINIVYMEDYLRGVVPPEIGKRTDSEIEAVKAQAVAARTYAMSHLKQYGTEPFDMKSSILDQVYEGVKVEEKLVDRALEATAGYVVTYQDEFINAYYHSTCGGMTDDIADVWDRKAIPYLKPVNDGDACSWSKYYRWQEVFTEEQLRGHINQYLTAERGREINITPITDLIITGRSAGGRINRLTVKTRNDSYSFYNDKIRWAVKRTSQPELILPSSNFQIEMQRDNSGQIVKIILKGQGYGHGVGMCQCGAIGLARKGWTFDKILKHYYSSVDVKKLY